MAKHMILIVAVILSLYQFAAAGGEAEALLAFKAQLQDPNRVLRGWSVSSSPCSWRGVTCSHGRVVALELQDAGLRGPISAKLGELTNLEALNLLGNDDLEGTIPAPLCNCNLLKVPASVSCGRRISEFRGITTRRSLLTTSRKRSAGFRWGVGLAVGLVSGAVAATLLALATRVVLGCFTEAQDLKKPIIFNKKITPQMLAFLDKEDALTHCKVLGEGGNGKVYQVTLQDDIVVAIKCVGHHSMPEDDGDGISHDAKQIRAELETLGFIRHRNLVQLLAYVFKPDSHLLVYEYMPGGSLQDALNRMAKGTLTLSWPERHRILCGVAHGLAYLHTESLGSSIVHRDLKPANILLDEGYEAKLGDFGLAAIVPLKATHATTDVLAGTIGFIAPEYHQTMRYPARAIFHPAQFQFSNYSTSQVHRQTCCLPSFVF